MTLSALECLRISSADECAALRMSKGLPVIDPQRLVRERTDAHWAVVENGEVAARCSLWWTASPPCHDECVGRIGHYAAGSGDAADALLNHACEQLQAHGCTLGVGPMNGNTWHDYRFATDLWEEPAFFLEPVNPPEWPAQFIAAGFAELAHYFSAVADDLSRSAPRVERVRQWMDQRGVRIRNLREASWTEDLLQIYRVVVTAFRDHLLFIPVGEAAFLEQFEPLRACGPASLVLIAEQAERVVGFCFGIPDLRQAERGEPIDTLILKTFGVLPGREYAGLGQLLLEEMHHRAQSLGYRRVIHALVREAGHVQRISQRYARPIRRYTLFARGLCR